MREASPNPVHHQDSTVLVGSLVQNLLSEILAGIGELRKVSLNASNAGS